MKGSEGSQEAVQVLQISCDGMIGFFLSVTFSVLGFLWVAKFGKYLFGCSKQSEYFL